MIKIIKLEGQIMLNYIKPRERIKEIMDFTFRIRRLERINSVIFKKFEI